MPVTAFTIGQSQVGDLPQLGGTPQSISKPTADTCAATDTTTAARTSSRTSSDTCNATDAATRTFVPAGSNTADTSAATDTASRARTSSRTSSDTAAATDALSRVHARTTTDTATATDTTGDLTIIGPFTVGTSQVGGPQTFAGRALGVPTVDSCAALDSAGGQVTPIRNTADTCTAVDAIRAAQFPEATNDLCAAVAIFGHAGVATDTCLAADSTTRLYRGAATTADSCTAIDAASPSGANFTPGTYGYGHYGDNTYGNRYAGGPPFVVGNSQIGGLSMIGGQPLVETLATTDVCAAADSMAGPSVAARTTADTAAAVETSSLSQLKTTADTALAADSDHNVQALGALTADITAVADSVDTSSPGGRYSRSSADLCACTDFAQAGQLAPTVETVLAVDTIVVKTRHGGPYELLGVVAPDALDLELQELIVAPVVRTGACRPTSRVGAVT